LVLVKVLDIPVCVSIPFIAGQWSLQPAPDPAAERAAVSIPFIAGQWSLQEAERRAAKAGVVSIPFIAGQWSLPAVCGGVLLAAQIVSIPFIAGQWSLLFECPLAERRGARSFNPLHCGAVVASILCATSSLGTLVSIPFIAGQWSLHRPAS